ncbi:hypothetical protein HDU97_002624 [Phlyctochytrium planicorne]|nr:hypothetical protein HDU97_002611 [Phlyctochytrium planicorne]KAJ3100017.1 hypothetical protein HDU97_002624 [Phlyctochytrium planicorne]
MLCRNITSQTQHSKIKASPSKPFKYKLNKPDKMFKSILLALLPALALAAPSRKPCGDGQGAAAVTFVGVNTPPPSTWKVIDSADTAAIQALGIPTDDFGAMIVQSSFKDDKATMDLCLFDDDGDINFAVTLPDGVFCGFRFGSTTPFTTNLFLNVLKSGNAACTISESKLTNDGATAAFTVQIAK